LALKAGQRFVILYENNKKGEQNMLNISVVLVLNKDASKMLLCRRSASPFKGLQDFVGGKREPNENGLECAYRELFEETGISEDDITLQHIMEFTYCLDQKRIQVFAGKLSRDVILVPEKNELLWTDLDRDFCD
jgi:8-oxo-dGTP diphosphatase